MKKINIKKLILALFLLMPIFIFAAQTTRIVDKNITYQMFNGLGFTGDVSADYTEDIVQYDANGNKIGSERRTWNTMDFGSDVGPVGKVLYNALEAIRVTLTDYDVWEYPYFAFQYADYVVKILFIYISMELLLFIPECCYKLFDKFIRRNEQ